MTAAQFEDPEGRALVEAIHQRKQGATVKTMAEVLEELWDDGNCTGLDGWIGPGRGSAEVDDDALHNRDRAIQRATSALAAAGFGPVQEERAEAWAEGHESGFWNGRLSQLNVPYDAPDPLIGNQHADATNPYRETE